MSGGARWHVWRDLRARDHIDFAWGVLESGHGRIEDLGDGRRRITVDIRLDRRHRWATLGHELVHDERGGGCDVPGMPTTWRPEVIKEERRVERIVAGRFVPPDELRQMVRKRVDADLVVTVHDVVDEFDVAPHVAREALLQLAS